MTRDPEKLRAEAAAKFGKWPEPGSMPTGNVGMKLVAIDDGCAVNVSLQDDVTVIELEFPSGKEWFVIIDHNNPPADTMRGLADFVNEQFKGHAVFECCVEEWTP